jgi:hypothetical protein
MKFSKTSQRRNLTFDHNRIENAHSRRYIWQFADVDSWWYLVVGDWSGHPIQKGAKSVRNFGSPIWSFLGQNAWRGSKSHYELRNFVKHILLFADFQRINRNRFVRLSRLAMKPTLRVVVCTIAESVYVFREMDLSENIQNGRKYLLKLERWDRIFSWHVSARESEMENDDPLGQTVTFTPSLSPNGHCCQTPAASWPMPLHFLITA